MATDMETAFAAIRWQHIRAIESMQALTERNVELEREVHSHTVKMNAERQRRKKALMQLKIGLTDSFRSMRGELEITRTLIYTQSAMALNDTNKIVKKLGFRLSEVIVENERLKEELSLSRGQVARLQDQVGRFEDELAGNLKEQLAAMKADLLAERARNNGYDKRMAEYKKLMEDKLYQVDTNYKALNSQYTALNRKLIAIEAEHSIAINNLLETHRVDLNNRDEEIMSLQQLLSVRNQKIEYLEIELEKAKSQITGGSHFKKFVELKSQNVELLHKVEGLSKQVQGKANPPIGQTSRVGRRGAAPKNRPVPLGLSSVGNDSIISEFAEENHNQKQDLKQYTPAPIGSSQSAFGKRRHGGGAGLDPSILSPASSIDQLPKPQSQRVAAGSYDEEEAGDTSQFGSEQQDTFSNRSLVGELSEAYKAPRRRREPTAFSSGLPNHYNADGNMMTSTSLKFSSKDMAKLARDDNTAESLSERSTHPPNSLSSKDPTAQLIIKISPRPLLENQSNAARYSPPVGFISHSPVKSYDPAVSLFSDGGRGTPPRMSPRRHLQTTDTKPSSHKKLSFGAV